MRNPHTAQVAPPAPMMPGKDPLINIISFGLLNVFLVPPPFIPHYPVPFQAPPPPQVAPPQEENDISNTFNAEEEQEFTDIVEKLNGSKDSIKNSKDWIVDKIQHAKFMAFRLAEAAESAGTYIAKHKIQFRSL